MRPFQIRDDDIGGTVTDRRLIIGSFLTPAEQRTIKRRLQHGYREGNAFA